MRFPFNKSQPEVPVTETTVIAAPSYPPIVEGTPIFELESILLSQAHIIDRTRDAAGVDTETFDRIFLSVIKRLALYIQMVPASENHHHCGLGGLFRHSLEVGMWCLRSSHGSYFGDSAKADSSRRREPIWRYAVWLCGLLHDMGKPLLDFEVISVDQVHRWNPHTKTIYAWAHDSQVSHYQVRWRRSREHNAHIPMTLTGKVFFIGSEANEYLDSGSNGSEIWLEISKALSGVRGSRILPYIQKADEESVRHDRKLQASIYMGRTNTSVERHLIDALKTLYAAPETKRYFFNTPAGMGIMWPAAIIRAIESIHESNPGGVPSNPETLTSILLDTGYIDHLDGDFIFELEDQRHNMRYSVLRWINPRHITSSDVDPVYGEYEWININHANETSKANLADSHNNESTSSSPDLISTNNQIDITGATLTTENNAPKLDYLDAGEHSVSIKPHCQHESNTVKTKRTAFNFKLSDQESKETGTCISAENITRPGARESFKFNLSSKQTSDKLPNDLPTPTKPITMSTPNRTLPDTTGKRRPNSPHHAHLVKMGAHGAVLAALSADLHSGIRTDLVFWKEGCLYIQYPDALKGYGRDPKLVRAELSGAFCLAIDELLTKNERYYLCIKKEISILVSPPSKLISAVTYNINCTTDKVVLAIFKTELIESNLIMEKTNDGIYCEYNALLIHLVNTVSGCYMDMHYEFCDSHLKTEIADVLIELIEKGVLVVSDEQKKNILIPKELFS